jgi:transcriptional regulator with XRE-family HTH domain
MTLGQFLKESRHRAELSLRDVERETGISNGYLSLMESGGVKGPSPKFLRQLADTYGVAYSLLMELAGYEAPAPAPKTNAGVDRFDELTEAERLQVDNFVRFLRSSRAEPGRRNR